MLHGRGQGRGGPRARRGDGHRPRGVLRLRRLDQRRADPVRGRPPVRDQPRPPAAAARRARSAGRSASSAAADAPRAAAPPPSASPGWRGRSVVARPHRAAVLARGRPRARDRPPRASPPTSPRSPRLAALTFPLACPPGSTAPPTSRCSSRTCSRPRAVRGVPRRPAPRRARGARRPRRRRDSSVGYTHARRSRRPPTPTSQAVADARTRRSSCRSATCHPDHHGAGRRARAHGRVARRGPAHRGAAGMWLGVNQQNARARSAFYERSGFAVVGTKHFTVGDPPRGRLRPRAPALTGARAAGTTERARRLPSPSC